MNSTFLNEHDANQGAQSSGEFLGMTGNSGWLLLGSGGATILMVIFLWGIFGVSLLLCLFVGILLCLGSLAYVFALKNGKPEHYDTDFLESALVEAGVWQFSFGPRACRPVNPFTDGSIEPVPAISAKTKSSRRAASGRRNRVTASQSTAATPLPADDGAPAKIAREKPHPVVKQSDYDSLQEKLTTAEELLEEVMAGAEEN